MIHSRDRPTLKVNKKERKEKMLMIPGFTVFCWTAAFMAGTLFKS